MKSTKFIVISLSLIFSTMFAAAPAAKYSWDPTTERTTYPNAAKLRDHGVKFEYCEPQEDGLNIIHTTPGSRLCIGRNEIIHDMKSHPNLNNRYYPICSEGLNRSQVMAAVTRNAGITVYPALSLHGGCTILLKKDCSMPIYSGISITTAQHRAAFDQIFGHGATNRRIRSTDDNFVTELGAIDNRYAHTTGIFMEKEENSVEAIQIQTQATSINLHRLTSEEQGDQIDALVPRITEAARQAFDNYVRQTLQPLPSGGKHVFLIMLKKEDTEFFCTLLYESLTRLCGCEGSAEYFLATTRIKIITLNFADPINKGTHFNNKPTADLNPEELTAKWAADYAALAHCYTRMMGLERLDEMTMPIRRTAQPPAIRMPVHTNQHFYTCSSNTNRSPVDILFFYNCFTSDCGGKKHPSDQMEYYMTHFDTLIRKNVVDLTINKGTFLLQHGAIIRFLVNWPSLRILRIKDHTLTEELPFFAELRSKGIAVEFSPFRDSAARTEGVSLAHPALPAPAAVRAEPSTGDGGGGGSGCGESSRPGKTKAVKRSHSDDNGIREFTPDLCGTENPVECFKQFFGPSTMSTECEDIKEMTIREFNAAFFNAKDVGLTLCAMPNLRKLTIPTQLRPEPSYFRDLRDKGVTITCADSTATIDDSDDDLPSDEAGQIALAMRRSVEDQARKRRRL